MKKLMNIVLIALMMMCLITPVYAASASASLSGPGTVRAGDTITLTFKVNGSDIYGVSGKLSYDSEQLTLKSTKQKVSGGWAVEFNGNNFVAYDNNLSKPINKSTSIFTATFKVKELEPGTSIKVSCTGVTASDGASDIGIGTVSYSKKIAQPLSGANDLKSLTVSNATISPSFSPNVTSYTASVPYEVEKLSVKATGVDKSKVSINSPKLKVNGKTNVTITVTAENGNKQVYTIVVKRAQDPNYVPSSNNNLTNIEVEGFMLSPKFEQGKTEYLVWLPYEVDNINVKATNEDKLGSFRVEGNTNLVAGSDNVVKVIGVAENGDEKVYTITAKRAASHDEPIIDEPVIDEPVETPEKDGFPWWLLLVALIVGFATGLGAGFVIKKR